MKCFHCNLVNPTDVTICKRCHSTLFMDKVKRTKIFRDSGFLVVENTIILPKRCYKCNSKKIVASKMQTLVHIPVLEQLLDFAVGQLIPIPLPLPLTPNRREIKLNVCFCRRHRSLHQILFKVGVGILLFSIICFAIGFYFNNYSEVFVVLMIISVVTFCIGVLTLYIEKEREIVSQHKYQPPYFWIKGFGEEYLESFPKWTNSPPK